MHPVIPGTLVLCLLEEKVGVDFVDVVDTLLEEEKKRFFGCPTGVTFKGSLNGSKWVFRTILENC